jgi:hypothetical protein
VFPHAQRSASPALTSVTADTDLKQIDWLVAQMYEMPLIVWRVPVNTPFVCAKAASQLRQISAFVQVRTEQRMRLSCTADATPPAPLPQVIHQDEVVFVRGIHAFCHELRGYLPDRRSVVHTRKVRRARFGPGLWPGPRRQARWAAEAPALKGGSRKSFLRSG